MAKALTVHDVARYILARQDPSAEPITNKKLQKLVYLAQGTTLAMLHRSLWDTDRLGARVTAWKEGPVVPELWREYKAAGYRPLPVPSDFDPNAIDSAGRAMVDSVLATYGRLSVGELTKLTHSHDPWINTREKAQKNPNDDVIPEAELAEFFTQVLAGPNDARKLTPEELAAWMRSKPEWVDEDAQSAAEISAGRGLSLGELRRFLGL